MELSKKVRQISKEKALEEYEELKKLDCSKIGRHLRLGLKTLDYFMLHHRLRTKTKRHISFYEATKDKEVMDYVNEKIRKIRGKEPTALNEIARIKERYDVFQLYYGTINQFRPTEAKRLYCTLQPKRGILDFSAGWGGRCLAAMSYGVPYIGIDANEKLESSYKKMIQMLEPGADVKMIFKPSETVDFSKFNYDLVFTSPPYFMLEEYEKMPAYGSKEGFLEKFFRPVVLSAWKHLHSPGFMALNMPKEMYDSVKSLLPPLWKRLRLPVAGRHPVNAARGQEIGKMDKGTRSEGIYIWKKGGNKTRKAKR
jgi:hypothetical protein